jgi:hypothetical protein
MGQTSGGDSDADRTRHFPHGRTAANVRSRKARARRGGRAVEGTGLENLSGGFCRVMTGYASSKIKVFFAVEVTPSYDVGAGSGH